MELVYIYVYTRQFLSHRSYNYHYDLDWSYMGFNLAHMILRSPMLLCLLSWRFFSFFYLVYYPCKPYLFCFPQLEVLYRYTDYTLFPYIFAQIKKNRRKNSKICVIKQFIAPKVKYVSMVPLMNTPKHFFGLRTLKTFIYTVRIKNNSVLNTFWK